MADMIATAGPVGLDIDVIADQGYCGYRWLVPPKRFHVTTT
jgi:hypothetical protein